MRRRSRMVSCGCFLAMLRKRHLKAGCYGPGRFTLIVPESQKSGISVAPVWSRHRGSGSRPPEVPNHLSFMTADAEALLGSAAIGAPICDECCFGP